MASASADGAPYPVPRSFARDGGALLMATPTDSPTGTNLTATRAVRLALGHTRDVPTIEVEVEAVEIDALPHKRGDRFVAHTGFDPGAPWPRPQGFHGPKRGGYRGSCAERDPGQRHPDGRRATPADTADQVSSDRCRDRADDPEPDVLLEAGHIEPGDADGDRAGGSA